MKKLILVAFITSLIACSSIPNVSLAPYYQQIQQDCLSKLDSITDERKTNCASKANFKTTLAQRLYEKKSKQIFASCQQQHTNENDITNCFQKQQRSLYDNYFNIKVDKDIPAEAF